MLRLRQAVLTVVSCILIFGALGAFTGHLLGDYAPSFVEFLKGSGDEYPSSRETAEFGLGMGLFGGLGFGGFLGITLVVLLTLRDAWVVAWTRTLPPDGAPKPAGKPKPPAGHELG